MRTIVIAALLGGWTTGTVGMGWLAAQNFRMVDRLLSSPRPEFSRALAPLPPTEARAVLRDLASEMNRRYFRLWGFLQVALALILVMMAATATPRDRGSVLGLLAMFLLTLLLTFILHPQIVSLGRSLDFLPRDPVPPSLRRFWTLHLLYTTLDGVKLLIGLLLLIRTGWRG